MTPQHPSPAPTGELTLEDGRTLVWDEHGNPTGAPVILMHGAPSCRVLGAGLGRAATGDQVRLIIPDRPGCGLSTQQPERRILDWPRDISALADHLNLDHYSVVGTSGGGPYALACAAGDDRRLARTAVAAGVGPLDSPEARAGLYDTNRALFQEAAKGVEQIIPILQALTDATVGPQAGMEDLLSPEDRRAVDAHPEILTYLLESTAAAFVNGVEGLAYDIWLFTQPWGLDLEEISQPVDFYAADHDRNVPLQHAVDQAAAVPQSNLTVWPEAGHLACLTRLPEVLARVTRPL